MSYFISICFLSCSNSLFHMLLLLSCNDFKLRNQWRDKWETTYNMEYIEELKLILYFSPSSLQNNPDINNFYLYKMKLRAAGFMIIPFNFEIEDLERQWNNFGKFCLPKANCERRWWYFSNTCVVHIPFLMCFKDYIRKNYLEPCTRFNAFL